MASSTDYFKLHFIVFLWGFSAILGKLVTVPAADMIWYRAILATIGMGVVIYVTGGRWKVSRTELVKLLAIGLIVAFHWITFFGSARVSNVSVSLVGFATNSLWAALLEPLFLRSRIKRYELFLGLMVLTGLYIIFSFDFQYKFGLMLGVLAGFTSALFSVFNARMVKTVPARTITFYEMAGVIGGTGVFLLLYHGSGAGAPFRLPGAMDLLYISILAGVCSVYAYTVAVELMKRISVFMIQLSLNLEPIYGIVMAVLIFGQDEKMSTKFYIGTGVILAAVMTYPLMKKRFERTVLID